MLKIQNRFSFLSIIIVIERKGGFIVQQVRTLAPALVKFFWYFSVSAVLVKIEILRDQFGQN
jgi:hypothetical protein